MATRFIGLAIADSMFAPDAFIQRKPLTVEQVKELVNEGVVSACNASHANTLQALETKHGIQVSAQGAPKVNLTVGDSIIVMSVRGLPRLEGTTQYTDEQVAAATFAFGIWTVNA
jgi:hypothetical protein